MYEYVARRRGNMLPTSGQLSDFCFEHVAALVNTGTLKAGL
jgi:hypothetical protein